MMFTLPRIQLTSGKPCMLPMAFVGGVGVMGVGLGSISTSPWLVFGALLLGGVGGYASRYIWGTSPQTVAAASAQHEQTLVLASLLEDVSADLEATIGEIINQFLDLAAKAGNQSELLGKTAGAAEKLDTGTEVISMDEFSHAVAEEAQEIVSTIVWICKSMMQVTYQLEELQKHTKTINGFMEQVDFIAKQTDLLALNAAIEAARAGDHGRGFMVVAEEVRKLANESSSFSVEIRREITAITKGLDESFGSVKEVVGQDMNPLIERKVKIEKLVELLITQKQGVLQMLEMASADVGKMSNNIFSIVQGLQFQDRIKQRLEHVIEPLKAMTEVNKPQKANGAKVKATAVNGMSESYTMQAEREAHARALTKAEGENIPPEQPKPVKHKTPQDDMGDNIDLF